MGSHNMTKLGDKENKIKDIETYLHAVVRC